jgi:chemotaxis protein methyltransferase CheR
MIEKISDLILERGFDSHLDYYYLLKYEADAEDEWRKLINALSVRETFFWREIDQVRALVDVVVPQHFAASAEPLIIWSAACSSGEEPLTIAIALDAAGLLTHPISIYASDASEAAIRQARAGRYRQRSFRVLPPELHEKYFRQCGDEWEVCSTLRDRIVWETANLADARQIDALARAHVIFCRNVFIYFSDAAIKHTVKLFAERMRDPGYLFIGASESLLRLSSEFALREIQRAFVYVRSSGGS